MSTDCYSRDEAYVLSDAESVGEEESSDDYSRRNVIGKERAIEVSIAEFGRV